MYETPDLYELYQPPAKTYSGAREVMQALLKLKANEHMETMVKPYWRVCMIIDNRRLFFTPNDFSETTKEVKDNPYACTWTVVPNETNKGQNDDKRET